MFFVWLFISLFLTEIFNDITNTFPFVLLCYIFLRTIILEKNTSFKIIGTIWFIMFLVISALGVSIINDSRNEDVARWQQLKVDNPGKSLAELEPGFSTSGIGYSFIIFSLTFLIHISWIVINAFLRKFYYLRARIADKTDVAS